jgi:hypothetical protein
VRKELSILREFFTELNVICCIIQLSGSDQYRTITLPMKVNGQQGFVTQLQDVPKYFVSSLAQNLVGEIMEIPASPVVEEYEVKWHTENTQSCLYHLMRDQPVNTALTSALLPCASQYRPTDRMLSGPLKAVLESTATSVHALGITKVEN